MVAIDLITQHIRMKLQQPDLRRIYHNLEVIPSNFQIRGMHTILRDQNTNKTDFIFIADRLLRLVRSTILTRTNALLYGAHVPALQFHADSISCSDCKSSRAFLTLSLSMTQS